MDRNRVLELVLQYADARVAHAIQRAKDPWITSNFGCIERAAKAEEECDRLIAEIEEELSKE